MAWGPYIGSAHRLRVMDSPADNSSPLPGLDSGARAPDSGFLAISQALGSLQYILGYSTAYVDEEAGHIMYLLGQLGAAVWVSLLNFLIRVPAEED